LSSFTGFASFGASAGLKLFFASIASARVANGFPPPVIGSALMPMLSGLEVRSMTTFSGFGATPMSAHSCGVSVRLKPSNLLFFSSAAAASMAS
jgi:hypothetical protein